jgi:hypothetical protein
LFHKHHPPDDGVQHWEISRQHWWEDSKHHRHHGNGGQSGSGNGDGGWDQYGEGHSWSGGDADDGDDLWNIFSNASHDETHFKDCLQMQEHLDGLRTPKRVEARVELWRLKNVVSLLCDEIPIILHGGPTWRIYAANFTVRDVAGANLHVQKPIEMLTQWKYMYTPPLNEVSLIKEYDARILFDVRDSEQLDGKLNIRPLVRWNFRISGAKPPPFPHNLHPFHEDGHVDVQVVASLHIDSEQMVDYMQIHEWRLNGKPFDRWPKLDLSAPPR